MANKPQDPPGQAKGRNARQESRPSAEPVQLSVYVRQGCHLCDEMMALLREFQKDYNFTYEAIDVDSDEALYQRFNVLVPALLMGDREICHHFFDLSALQRALEGAADSSQADPATDSHTPLIS